MRFGSPKDPSEVKEYTLDWSQALNAGESISTSVWSVQTGLTQSSESETSTTTTIVVSGGTAGNEYTAENTITTNSSPARTLVETLFIPVVQL